ncbi:MAG: GNAT family N-acetyltransferase [Pseudomonadota bacterium]
MTSIHRGHRPALLGEIVSANARWYADHWGFGLPFETKVAAGLAEFLPRAGKDDLILSAWDKTGGAPSFAASLILDAQDPACRPGEAYPRWFIAARPGGGLGRRMMEEAVGWLDARGLACFLDTFAGLHAARRLYEAHGFTLVHEAPDGSWGVEVRGQRVELPARI